MEKTYCKHCKKDTETYTFECCSCGFCDDVEFCNECRKEKE